jgi:hypothetical protein
LVKCSDAALGDARAHFAQSLGKPADQLLFTKGGYSVDGERAPLSAFGELEICTIEPTTFLFNGRPARAPVRPGRADQETHTSPNELEIVAGTVELAEAVVLVDAASSGLQLPVHVRKGGSTGIAVTLLRGPKPLAGKFSFR